MRNWLNLQHDEEENFSVNKSESWNDYIFSMIGFVSGNKRKQTREQWEKYFYDKTFNCIHQCQQNCQNVPEACV